MSARSFLPLLVCCLLLSGCSTGQFGSSPKSAIRVTIPYDSHDALEAFGHRRHDGFHVLLTNVSRTPIRVWQEWCSWGYYCLQIEVVEKDGTEHLLRKKPVPFYANFPDYVVLQPGQCSVWDVNLHEASVWTDLSWFPKDKMVNARVRAIFTVPSPTTEGDRLSGADRLGVWTGQAISDYQDFTLYGPISRETTMIGEPDGARAEINPGRGKRGDTPGNSSILPSG
jgi:hypothetical protein